MAALKTLESKNEYDIGWVAALAIERAAATALLDERHDQPRDFIQNSADKNSYTWGRISNHNVVIASLPTGGYGLTNATKLALGLVASCPHIKIGLLVGIGAGVPECGLDIRLGDVAVSRPYEDSPGVVQYDSGKAKNGNWQQTGVLVPPPEVLLIALAKLQAEHELEDSKIPALLAEASGRSKKFGTAYGSPGAQHDRLFSSSMDGAVELEVPREARSNQDPMIHYGTIGSGNTLIKDASTRQAISRFLGTDCICLEMEAAGLMSSFPCLVVRGICDYADSHKNDLWQRYASATAAAFTKELLLYVPKSDIGRSRRIDQILEKVHSGVEQLNDNFLRAEERTRTERLNQLVQRLYDHPHEQRKDRNPKRILGTCEWFTKHHLFKQWLSGKVSDSDSWLYRYSLEYKTQNTLWVTADPGCGKSVLARYLVDVVLPRRDRYVCYFFFKDDFEDQKTAIIAGSTMLHQVLTSYRQLITNSILEECDVYGEKFADDFSNLWKALTAIASALSIELICVIDALDECRAEDRDKFLKSISQSYSTEKGEHNVKVLVLSRPYFNIARSFDQAYPCGSVIRLAGENDAEREEISREIDIVLDQRISEFCERRDLDSNDKDFLVQEFTSVPQRTYLWAHLTMAMLEDNPEFTRGNARRTLNSIPSTVDAAYEKILNRTSNASKTRLALEFILAANRAFTVVEMGILLALDGHHTHYNELKEFLEPETRFRTTLRELCGLFIVIVDHRVYLLHQTAREFLLYSNAPEFLKFPEVPTLLGVRVDRSPTDVTSCSPKAHWGNTFSTSLCCLTLVRHCLWLLNVALAKHQEDSRKLFQYAAIHWVKLLDSLALKPGDAIYREAYNVLEATAPNLRDWFDSFWASKPVQRHFADSDTGRGRRSVLSHIVMLTGDAFPFVMASILGSKSLVAGLLAMFPGRWKETAHSQALWWSLCYGETESAGSLLVAGADANTIASGESALAESVLDKVDLNIVASLRLRQVPLSLAAQLEDAELVKLLLQHGANPNPSPNHAPELPLQSAINQADAGMILHLLEHGAAFNTPEVDGLSCFRHFVDMEHSKMCTEPMRGVMHALWAITVENNGDDVNKLLHQAIGRLCLNCTKWCLDHGADVWRCRIIEDKTPLEYAKVVYHRQHSATSYWLGARRPMITCDDLISWGYPDEKRQSEMVNSVPDHPVILLLKQAQDQGQEAAQTSDEPNALTDEELMLLIALSGSKRAMKRAVRKDRKPSDADFRRRQRKG